VSAALHLAGPDDLDRLLPMVAVCHLEDGRARDEAHRRAGLAPLLEGSPLGAVYLIGPRKAPVGYIVVSFGWSLEFGGMDGFVDEFWIRPNVRGRGMGSEVLGALVPALEAAGLRALHLEAGEANLRAQGLYARHGFRLREGYRLMTRLAR
jgi:ribosomal protein S18 acetylase RimI-like enzyme